MPKSQRYLRVIITLSTEMKVIAALAVITGRQDLMYVNGLHNPSRCNELTFSLQESHLNLGILLSETKEPEKLSVAGDFGLCGVFVETACRGDGGLSGDFGGVESDFDLSDPMGLSAT